MKKPTVQLVEAIREYQHILICVKGSPDPDVLASSFVVKLLCEKHGKKARVVATKGLSLAQNRRFVKLLNLPCEFTGSFARAAAWADAYVVLDHPSIDVEGIPASLPCVVHIDHHASANDSKNARMRWCNTNVGSASTLVSTLLERCYLDLSFSDSEMARMATALLFGIQTDTDKYALAAKADYAAIHFLSRFCDDRILKKLSDVPLSRSTATHLQLAQRNKKFYKDWLITSVGYLPEKNRDDIAITADFLLRREKATLVIVYAIIQNERARRLTLEASLRCADPHFPLNSMIRRVARDGGARKSKGAFQVSLDYFSEHASRDELLVFIEKVTVAKLQNAKDSKYKDIMQDLFAIFQNRVGMFTPGRLAELARRRIDAVFSFLRQA